MSPPTPARCASRPATPRSCAAAPRACAPRAPSTPVSSRGSSGGPARGGDLARADTPDRAAVGAMLAGLDGNIDVIVPRGGKSLVARVQHEARVPVFAHLEGIVHVFVHEDADLDMAKRDRAQRQDAPHRHLRRGRDAARRPRLRGDASRAARVDADRRGLRSARRRGDAGRRRAREAGERRRLAHGISRRDHRRARRRRARGGDRPYRDLWLASHRLHRHAR